MHDRRRLVRPRRLLLCLAFTSALAGCDLLTGPRSPKAAPEELKSLPRALSATEQGLIAGSNAFAFGLLRETVRQESGPNVFVSPLSASMALGMTMNGARGPTLSEMQTTLGFGGVSLSAADQAYRSLIDLLLGLDVDVDVRLANSIWARQGYPFEQSFYDTVRQYFEARGSTLDFNNPSAVPTINDWVKQSTNGKIPEIIQAPIDASLVMFLINAVYFKASWRDRFDPAGTRAAPFHAAAGTSSVQMMHRSGPGEYFATADGVRGVELPYARGAYVMDIVLPPEGTDLRSLVQSLDTAQWHRWLARLGGVSQLELSMPRFRLAYETVLNQPLQTLGMRTAFSALADFTAMSRDGGLAIGFVKQKTYVDVDEQGTEAAAVTVVGMTAISLPTPTVITFVVDRPFLMAIRERFSGLILLLGAIGAPASP